MSAPWKSLCVGGVSTSTKNFCTCCMVDRNRRGTPALDTKRCARCIERNIASCFDHPVCDTDYLKAKNQELQDEYLENLAIAMEKFDAIKKHSALLTDDRQVGAADNEKHINFSTDGRLETVIANYSLFLMTELLLRYPQRVVEYALLTLEERRARLIEEVCIKEDVDRIRQALLRKEKVADIALILVEQAMPCLLHCENRVNEKIFHVLLQHGMLRYGDAGNERRLAFVDSVSACMRTEALGTRHNPSQWRFPFAEDDPKVVKRENLTNPRSRKYLHGIEAVINTIFSPANDECDDADTRLENEKARVDWLHVATIYKEVIVPARQEDDFTDDDIDLFHDKCGEFMVAWVNLAGKENVGNYIHMIGAGHILHYIQKFRNLYKYSNQGWEALNQKIKRVYFNNTNRGGNVGGWQRLDHGHVEPLWMFLARSTVWKTGDAQRFFATGTNNN